MIAKIEPAFSSFSTLDRKVEYQMGKINSGCAKELFSTTGDTLRTLPGYMNLYFCLNERIKLPYSEITLNLSPGERLSDDDWISLSKDYMEAMGYGNCCYSVIINTDKDHSHVHILYCRIDAEGNVVSNSFDYRRSEVLSRNIEKKYNLNSFVVLEKMKERLSSVSGQRYFFDNALKKALKNYAVKDRLESLLTHSGVKDILGKQFLQTKLSNDEWMAVLGSNEYETILAILSKGGFFKSLYKDELLSKLDSVYQMSRSFQEFRSILNNEGVYMRLTSKKDKSYYVYGLTAESFYIKDSSLPLKYRYGSMSFDSAAMSYDEQKHYIFNKLNLALYNSSSYDEFKFQLLNSGVSVKELSNVSGIYGLTYTILDVDMQFEFKASDVSRKFTYSNLQKYFSSNTLTYDSTIHRVGEWRESIQRDNDYMTNSFVPVIPDLEITGGSRRNREDELQPKKKKKHKNNGLTI